MEAIERIEIDAKVYRRVAMTGGLSGMCEADKACGPQEPAPADWFWAWVPEDRFGIEYPAMPIDKVAD